MLLAAASSSTDVRPAPASTAAVASAGNSGNHGFSFKDFLDTINPLQHIPVIETIYRRITGDEISHAARIAGDTLYGGPVGLLGGYLNTKVMGKDTGAPVQVADTTAATPVQPGQIAVANGAGISPTSVTLAALPQHATSGLARSPAFSPQDMQVKTAQVGATVAPVAATPAAMSPPAASAPGIPIDMSPRGLMVMQGRAREHAPVPLDLPSGLMALNHPLGSANPTINANNVSAADFSQRMQDGLNKYRAVLMARQKSGASVDPAAAIAAPGAPMPATLQ